MAGAAAAAAPDRPATRPARRVRAPPRELTACTSRVQSAGPRKPNPRTYLSEPDRYVLACGRSARVLITPPQEADQWQVPTGFHLDVPLDRPARPGPGVLVFSFLSETGPGAGGTCVVPGSHRLIDAFLAEHQHVPVDRRLNVFLRHGAEWLRQLVNEDDRDPDRSARCFAGTLIGDTPVRVIELTGRPGDVVVTNLYTLHSGAPNTSPRMRLMAATAIGLR